VRLFVDGRYYEQADLETDPNLIEVVKCPYGLSLQQAMKDFIVAEKIQSIGVEGDRIDLSLYSQLNQLSRVKSFNNAELSKIIEFKKKAAIKNS